MLQNFAFFLIALGLQGLLFICDSHGAEPELIISPKRGQVQGGTRIYLSGIKFHDPPFILVDGVPCQDIKSLNDKRWSCSTPPHPIGFAEVWVKEKSGKFIRAARGFSYYSGLSLEPDPILLSTGKKLQLQGKGGTPPYSYSIVKGSAQVDSKTGMFSAPDSPGVGILSIKDQSGQSFEIGYEISPSLTLHPEATNIPIGGHLEITALGGNPPYQFSIVSGEGEFFEDVRLFLAPDKSGVTTLRVSDSLGDTHELKLTITEKTPIKARKISAGGRHSCSIQQNGVECWGDNGFGQLGDGTTKGSTIPVLVKDLAGKTDSVGLGFSHSCALIASALKCWGDNQYGQLGDGTLISKSVPVQVLGLESGVLGFATGGFHSCAMTHRGVFCWGKNEMGQFGNLNQDFSPIPLRTAISLENIRGIYAGSMNSCVNDEKSIKCWGDASWKEEKKKSPKKNTSSEFSVEALTGEVTDIALGWAHLCVLVSGSAKCLGYNGTGNLGSNSKDTKMTFNDVANLQNGVSMISAGQYHTCAIKDGKLYCWGNNSHGELGDGSRNLQLSPVPVKNISETVLEVSAGVSHTCAMLSNAKEVCWGDNVAGQLGDATYEMRTTPVQILRKLKLE